MTGDPAMHAMHAMHATKRAASHSIGCAGINARGYRSCWGGPPNGMPSIARRSAAFRAASQPFDGAPAPARPYREIGGPRLRPYRPCV